MLLEWFGVASCSATLEGLSLKSVITIGECHLLRGGSACCLQLSGCTCHHCGHADASRGGDRGADAF